jgi:hypothetical protein
MKQGTVLVVDQTDILSSAQHKELEEIDLCDFYLNYKTIDAHGIIIYVQGTRYKILKSRYFPLD